MEDGPIAGRVVVSSRFGPRPPMTITKPDGSTYTTSAFHSGVDMPAAVGTPLIARAPGRISLFDNNRWDSNGIMAQLRHENGWYSNYLHTWVAAPQLPVNTRLRVGDTLGYVGNSGASTGPHVHWSVVDPSRHVAGVPYSSFLDPLGPEVVDWINSFADQQVTPVPCRVETMDLISRTVLQARGWQITPQKVGNECIFVVKKGI